MVEIRNYTAPIVCEKEILRYAGCKDATEEYKQILREGLLDALPRLSYKVCFLELNVKRTGEVCDFDYFKVESKDLAANLDGCERVILFAATIGVEMDRLIARNMSISPTKAVFLQAIGTERIEALCDLFCKELERKEGGRNFRPRFSPGYGDLSIEMQKEILSVLNASKHIGLSLNRSLLMSPTKSVTAFVGIPTKIEEKQETVRHKCAQCRNLDCAYRE